MAREPGSFSKGFENFKRRLYLDRHHATERLAVITSIFTVLGLILFGSALGFSIEKNNATLSDKAVYTTQVTTSRTGVDVEVVNIFRSEDQQRAMVLMHIPDISKVSLDSNTYQSFLTGADQNGADQRLKVKPSGAVYVFGTSGYMGYLLNSHNGFPAQIYKLTMRANAELVAPGADVAKESAEASFQKYDQWRVFFNPGAKNAVISNALSQPKLDTKALFYEMVVADQEAKQHQVLENDLVKLKADLSAVDEYNKRLESTTVDGLHVVPPVAPVGVRGDSISGTPGTVTAASDDPNVPATITGSTLQLVTEAPMSGGFNFDWRAGNVKDGYLDSMMPSGMSYLTFMNNKASQAPTELKLNKIDWMMNNGTRLDNYKSKNVSTLDDINKTVQLLTTAYQTYYEDKKKYEVDDLGKLLSYEVQIRDVASNSNINASEKMLKIY